MKKIIILFFAVIISFNSRVTFAQLEDQERYEYVLKKSNNENLCRHMTKVFNRNFQYPFFRGATIDGKLQGLSDYRQDLLFERPPGLRYDSNDVSSLLLAKFPESPEFNEISWRQTQWESSEDGLSPILIAEVDIFNNGAKELLINSPLGRKRKYYGSLQGSERDKGKLVVIPAQSFRWNDLIKNSVLNEKIISEVKSIDFNWLEADYYRPFIYEKTVYLAQYVQYWESLNNSALEFPENPKRESLNIVKATQSMEPMLSDAAIKTEIMCEINMVMLTSGKAGK